VSAAHTPGPWHIEIQSDGVPYIYDETGNFLAFAHPKAAAFVLRACNAHDKLTAERDELVATLEQINTLACYASEENIEAREAALLQIGEKARTAVAKVKP
jgi:hypothetical protein